jgi:hypothetical protein
MVYATTPFFQSGEAPSRGPRRRQRSLEQTASTFIHQYVIYTHQIRDNFQLEVRYAYRDRENNQRNDYFLLDFVEFSQLKKFAEAIDKDANDAEMLESYKP